MLEDLSDEDRKLVAGFRAAYGAGERLPVERYDSGTFALAAWWAQHELVGACRGDSRARERRIEVARDVATHMRDLPKETVERMWRESIGGERMWRESVKADTCGEELFALPAAACARLSSRERMRLLKPMISTDYRYGPIPEPIARLLTVPETGDPVEIVGAVLWEDDFSELIVEAYAERLAAADVLPMLWHWITATAAKLSGKWLKTAHTLLTPAAVAVVRDVLRALCAHLSPPQGELSGIWLCERTATTLRGMVWTCELIAEPWVNDLVGEVAVRAGAAFRSEMLANAAIGVLGRRGGLGVVPQLARVQARGKTPAIRDRAGRTLAETAEKAGLTSEQLAERTVPTFGLRSDGIREEQGLRLHRAGTIDYVDASGRVRKTIPKSVDQGLLAEFRAMRGELKRTLSATRSRMEKALATGRTWPWEEVREHYLDHPLIGGIGRALIWELPGGAAGLPEQVADAWVLTGADGGWVRPEPGAEVRLWHPITHGVEDVRAWRDRLAELRQPVKQAFREVYPLTPVEERSGARSGRFAGHRLRYDVADGLLAGRGWSGLSRGRWSGSTITVFKELPGDLTAHWEFAVEENLDELGDFADISRCVSGALRFTSGDGEKALSEVSPLTLSEALRDADLTVSVASLGLDPHGSGDYWRSYGFGPLAETAEVRRDALARLLPRLAIADRCTLLDRFLRVRGELRTYRIHLGSGNVLMEPDDAYLCVVPGKDRDRVLLPFEADGGMLSVILSKAFLLAADTEITDEAITRQLGGGRLGAGAGW
ncbi:DUF4132 domain-containing protein [Nonomuraea longicatena]|uniref:DUF4132 domain-containing protein n=1 Tax=Nonomuraea longicatena TaxID=83682 RepID=A0ABN1NMX1_9ACTN